MESCEVIIIGGGPAGLSAAIYSARANLKPMVFMGVQTSSQLLSTTEVENYPGFSSILGPDLIDEMMKQAEKSGADLKYDDIQQLYYDDEKKMYVAESSMFGKIASKAVIFCTGSKSKTLDIPGAKKLWQKGISTCAVCDSRIAKDNRIVVVGGGDVACEEASYVAKIAEKVYLVLRRDVFKASPVMIERVKKCENIEIMYNSNVIEIIGDKAVEKVIIENNEKTKTTLDVKGLFWCIGNEPQSQLVSNLCERNEQGYILKHVGQMTSKDGLFVAGDCSDWEYRQAVVAAGAGCMAALECQRWLEDKQ